MTAPSVLSTDPVTTFAKHKYTSPPSYQPSTFLAGSSPNSLHIPWRPSQSSSITNEGATRLSRHSCASSHASAATRYRNSEILSPPLLAFVLDAAKRALDMYIQDCGILRSIVR